MNYRIIKAARKFEKEEMQAIVDDENRFQQIEPGGWDENGNDCPIHYRLENHSGYQMQAYQPNGKMMDGFHIGLVKCNDCGTIFQETGDEPFCYNCL